jgi:nonsense-mediated mRNA decay protein 3
MFLRDLEEDADLRANVQLWKQEKKRKGEATEGMDTDNESVADTEATDMSDDDDFPRIKDDELLVEGLTNMKMDDIAEEE